MGGAVFVTRIWIGPRHLMIQCRVGQLTGRVTKRGPECGRSGVPGGCGPLRDHLSPTLAFRRSLFDSGKGGLKAGGGMLAAVPTENGGPAAQDGFDQHEGWPLRARPS
jgi:hypothetical protein